MGIVCNLIKIEVGQLHSCELYICEAQRRRRESNEAHEKKKKHTDDDVDASSAK